MFKKIVSNLPFSPALVGQLGFYAKRLRKEETTRRLGLIFVALALIVQSFAVFQPSESANASSDTDMVAGGITSKSDYLKSYDANTKHLRDTMNYIGITRHEIATSKHETFKTGEKLSWGYASRFSYSAGERQYSIPNENGNKVTTVYSRPLKLWGSENTQISGWVGKSEKMGWFAIMESCGNLVTVKIPTPPPLPKPIYTCDALTAELISGNKYRFNGKATSKNGATIQDYTFNFGDNTTKTVTNPSGVIHTYANKGATYSAKLSVGFKVNGATKNISSSSCTVKIVVSQPPDPVYTCDALNAELVENNQYKFNGLATASSGATIQNYTFNFGDNTTKTVTNPSGVIHTYAKTGASYTARLNVNFNVNGALKSVTSNACTVKITVSEPPIPPIPPEPPIPPTPKQCLLNPDLLADDENCAPCPGNDTLWINDESCTPNIIKSKTATNTSQGFINASSTTAHAGDQISYTITIENTGLSPEMVKLEEQLGDVLEYSTLVDDGGGKLNETTKTLTWSDLTLNPKDKQTRTFVVKVSNEIPATAVGSSDPTSYDCKMSNIFGNSILINIDCPTPKIIESVATELPKTGPTENMIFAGVVLAITTYFYARNRQLKKEIYLIRKNVSIGTI